MYTLTLCLFIACLLPYLSKIPLVIIMNRQPKGYDNHEPRTQAASLTGFGARALAAHQNSFESLIIFSSAVLTALATQHTSTTIQVMAMVHIISRCVYHVFYLLNWASLRSFIWAIGIIMSLSIMGSCLSH